MRARYSTGFYREESPRDAGRSIEHVNKQERLIRQWTLLSAISQTRDGLRIAELRSITRQSRATVYRDLGVLEEAGIPITNERGRVRLLTEKELPPTGFSALQIASLQLARLQLEPLAGSEVVRELDVLLAKLRPKPAQGIFSFAAPLKQSPSPNVLKTLERAHRAHKRAVIDYCSTSRRGAPARLHIEPLVFHVADGDPYLLAYSVEHRAERTFKLARIGSAALTSERATHQASADAASRFAGSVKAWSGPTHHVEVHLDASIAWLAREYALPGQTEVGNPDGSVTIRATVAGLVEVQRRILAWGSAAEVVAPAELREAVRLELAAALGKYGGGPGPTKARREKSTGLRHNGLKQRETKAG